MNTDSLRARAVTMRRQYLISQRWWSAAYHGSALGAAVVAAGSTVAASISLPMIYTVALASITTLLSTLTALGRFDKKWRASRLSRGKVDTLLSDMDADNPDWEKIRKALNRINENYDASLLEDLLAFEEIVNKTDGEMKGGRNPIGSEPSPPGS